MPLIKEWNKLTHSQREIKTMQRYQRLIGQKHEKIYKFGNLDDLVSHNRINTTNIYRIAYGRRSGMG